MSVLRKLTLTVAILGFASLGGVMTVADAAVTHTPLFQLPEIPKEGPSGEQIAFPGPLERMESMTVDSNHLWVAEKSSQRSRLDEFDATTGKFLAQPVTAVAPTEYGEEFGKGIAVGHGLSEPVLYLGGKIGSTPVVSVFSEAGALKKNWTGASTPGGSFGGIVEGVAVDDSTDPLDPAAGDVYVAVPSKDVIDVFRPETEGEEHYVGQITGVTVTQPFVLPIRVAVDESNGQVIVQDGRFKRESPTVDVLQPTGVATYELVHRITGPPPNNAFAGKVGPSEGEIFTSTGDGKAGEIYVSEFSRGGGAGVYRLDQFDSTGAYDGQVEDIGDPYAIAVDPEPPYYFYAREEVYGPSVVIPDVRTSAPISLRPESAVLAGSVNPDGEEGVKCWFEWGTTESFGHTAPCPAEISKGTTPVGVEVPLAGLERGVTYYYRLEASDKNGTNPGEAWQTGSFTTPGAAVRNESVLDVSADSVSFDATVFPNGQATSVYFEYGPSVEYGLRLPVSPEAVGAGTVNIEAPAVRAQGLSAGAEYHYRVVLVSEAKPLELETVYGQDQTFTTQSASGSLSSLDGRGWEMVSPPNKLGARIEPGGYALQAAAGGDSIAYRGDSPTEAQPGGYSVAETMLSRRVGNGWSTRDISPSHDQAAGFGAVNGFEFRQFSTDLSRVAVQPVSSEFTPLSNEATESTSYLRSDFAPGDVEAACESSCYQPLVSRVNDTASPFAPFGEEPNGRCEQHTCGPTFQGASPDLSHVIVSSPVQLTSEPAPEGGEGVYEWSAGRLELVGVLPPLPEKLRGAPAFLAGTNEGYGFGPSHAVSEHGERVILEQGLEQKEAGVIKVGGDGLYMREVEAGETVRLDAVQGGGGPSEGLEYMTASSDDRRVFFLDSGQLTAAQSPSGEDLYEYNLDAPEGSRLTDLTADPGEAAAVKTVIGASEDGSYVYFIATGALAEGAHTGAANLYMAHEGTTKLIATPYEGSENAGGIPFFLKPSLNARVSPNGRWLAFMSRTELTGYDNRDAVSGKQDAEVYLYGAESGKLVCASCDPTGARPQGLNLAFDAGSFLNSELPLSSGWVAASVRPWSTIRTPVGEIGTFYQSRYLSNEGRLFFDSADALVAQDVDGTVDAYEYEPTGVGRCTVTSVLFVSRSAGCVDLVSAGSSPEESVFLDASETGGDAFILTQSQLSPQDYDSAYDVYDAQECTSASPCPPASAPQSPPCEDESSCRAPAPPQPALYGAPASATFSGIGNVVSSASATKAIAKKPTARCKRVRHKAGKGRCAKRKTPSKGHRSGTSSARKSAHKDRRPR